MNDETKTDPYEASILGNYLQGLFDESARERHEVEQGWLMDLRQYVGQYEPDVLKDIQAKGAGFCKAFIRITRTKVKAMDARIGDLVFGGQKRNWALGATPTPELEGVPEGANEEDVMKAARAGAENMTDEIADQLKESKGRKLARRVYHSGHLYGCGIMKGPLVETRQKTSYKQVIDGEGNLLGFQPVSEEVKRPYIEFCTVWDLYGEISAPSLEEMDYKFQRHLMTKADLQKLARRNDMNGKMIREHLLENKEGDATWESWEKELHQVGRSDPASSSSKSGRNRYEVLEYWGWLDVEELRKNGAEIPEDITGAVACNVWFFRHSGKIFKAVENPYDTVYDPYSFFVPEPEEGRPYGMSVPFLLRDTQALINGTVRAMTDNGAFSAGPQIEVDEGRLVTVDNAYVLRPFRIWITKSEYGNANTPAIRINNVANNAGSYMGMLSVYKSLSDESSAIPSYQHGERTPGVGRTASGLSMLMGAASLMMKDQLENWDEFWSSLLEKLFHWNMQFNPKQDIRGDFRVEIVGSHALAIKEMKGQQLEQFSMNTLNNADLPFMKRRALLIARAEAQDLDPNQFIKSKEEMEAEMKAQQQQQQPGQQPPPPGVPQPGMPPEGLPPEMMGGEGDPLFDDMGQFDPFNGPR